MITLDINLTADQALKAKHRALWALGDYPSVAREVIPALGPELVAAAGIRAGQRVLDVAAGDGNAAIPAARAGARVTASDLTPELLAAGRVRAGDLPITWEPGDAEALPYGDATFDATISSVGVMFAPHHQRAADELLRVTRSGGTIAHASWTPEGFVGQMFATMKPYVPTPPPRGAARAAVGRRVPRTPTVRRTCGGRGRGPADDPGRPVRHRPGVRRLLQGRLRSDDRGLPQDCRRARQDCRPRRRAGRPG